MKTIFSCFFCLFCLFTIGCTHQSSQENCVEIGSADAICVSTDTLGKTVRMNMLHGHYTTESDEVFVIVLNPQKLPLSYGRRWILERWENNQWVRLWTKKPTVFFDDEIIPITPPIYYCFSCPIKYYKTTPGKYRISTSMWNDLEKINLNAEFEIE